MSNHAVNTLFIALQVILPTLLSKIKVKMLGGLNLIL